MVGEGAIGDFELKACVHYFLSNFYFFNQMIGLQKLWKMFFISSTKLFLVSRYSHFCIFFLPILFLPFHTFQTQRDKWKWNNLSWIGLHKFADVISGITQKPLYIISSNLVRQYITYKEIFLNSFCNLMSNLYLVPGPYCFR